MVSPPRLAVAHLAFASACVLSAGLARDVPPPALLGAWFADSSPESPIFLGETAAAIKAASRSQSALKDGKSVTLPGIGKIEAVEKPEREVRNPQTGEKKMAEAHTAPKFKFSTTFKSAIRG